MTPGSDRTEPATPAGGDPRHRPRPIVLVVLDGFGIGRDPSADAIAAAPMPVWRALLERWPHAILRASEDAVGLPAGQMGNSEVGHLNLGTGQPVLQDLPRIDAATRRRLVLRAPGAARGMRSRGPRRRPAPRRQPHRSGRRPRQRPASRRARRAGRAARRPEVRVHALLDGRDTPPRSADGFIVDLETRLAAVHPDARIATVGGRYYAMDRDHAGSGRRAATRRSSTGWASTHRARSGRSRPATPGARTTSSSCRPSSTGSTGASATATPIVHANFRADRARQLVHALADPTFDGFDRTGPGGRPAPRDLLVVTMTEYEKGLPVEVAFPPEEVPSLAGGGVAGRLAPVPRRRDREVRPRDVLLQRRPRGRLAGRGPAARPEPAGRDLRPPAGDERRRGDRRARRRDRLGDATTSSSPTTRTPTWSATRASGRRRCGRWRRSTAASPASRPRSRRSTATIRRRPARCSS